MSSLDRGPVGVCRHPFVLPASLFSLSVLARLAARIPTFGRLSGLRWTVNR